MTSGQSWSLFNWDVDVEYALDQPEAPAPEPPPAVNRDLPTDGSLTAPRHSITVNTIDKKTEAVIGVISKGGIQPLMTNIPAGPGPGTAWAIKEHKLNYYRLKPKQ